MYKKEKYKSGVSAVPAPDFIIYISVMKNIMRHDKSNYACYMHAFHTSCIF